MDPTDIGIFNLAEKRMHWLDQRQSVLAQNIANGNTPGFKARDVSSFASVMADQGVTLQSTNPLHLQGTRAALTGREQPSDGRAPNGNTVAMEEQLGKIAETSSSQELVTNLYHKYKSMFEIVLGRSGSSMDISKAIAISAAGMDAQTERLRVIAENLANQDSSGSAPGADPYRRKTITFADRLDRELGVDKVGVRGVGTDKSDFRLKYDPSHPAANAQGYVKLPNVNPFVEIMDMREAQRGYSANLNVMEVTRTMLTRTIELLK